MKYFEVTFTTAPCNETINDVVSALAGEIGFESFVEWENGVQAYVQQTLFDEEALKDMVANFPLPDTQISYEICVSGSGKLATMSFNASSSNNDC